MRLVTLITLVTLATSGRSVALLAFLGICALECVQRGRAGTRADSLEYAQPVLVIRDEAIGTDNKESLVV